MTTLDTSKYMYILMRGDYEYEHSVSNAAFMINQHINDKDDSYLKSDLHKKLMDMAEKKRTVFSEYQLGVVYNAINESDKSFDFPSNFSFGNGFDCVRF